MLYKGGFKGIKGQVQGLFNKGGPELYIGALNPEVATMGGFCGPKGGTGRGKKLERKRFGKQEAFEGSTKVELREELEVWVTKL